MSLSNVYYVLSLLIDFVRTHLFTSGNILLYYGRQSIMAVPRRSVKPEDRISKSRFANSLILTILTLLALVAWIYHGIWALKVMIYKPYGNILNNLIYGPGTLVANVGLSLKLIGAINTKLLTDKIEADYKKYI
ncbi:uncharacterized protein RJT21DRAFT_27284 [Scheffersomyces amazonensis]|uniref:uncharacterized protein n=1 Tax=Scheffersomyces amazonensis TaxID=1078765 RepID=UPI00315C9B6B